MYYFNLHIGAPQMRVHAALHYKKQKWENLGSRECSFIPDSIPSRDRHLLKDKSYRIISYLQIAGLWCYNTLPLRAIFHMINM